jgi:hypothetical protein
MRERLEQLWDGRVPLARVFWEWAILWGTVANLIATGAALAIIVLDGPALLAVVVHFLPLPYNFLMVVAVWRSAARYAGGAHWAYLAAGAVVVWAVAMTVI